MTSVYRPILKASMHTLAHRPALVLFGLPIALTSVLVTPLGYLGWPNVWTRLILQFFAEPFFALDIPTNLTWKGTLLGLLHIARTDTGAFFGFLGVATIALATISVILLTVPRAFGATIDAVRRIHVGEHVSLPASWRRIRRFRTALFMLTILLPLLPPLAMLAIDHMANTIGETLVVLATIAGTLFAFVTITATIYGSMYTVLGGYSAWEALRAGWQRIRTYFFATLEFTIVMFALELALIALSFVLGSIAFVPIALLFVIFWALKWTTLFSWLIVATFALILLASLLVAMTLVTLATILWTHYFSALETVDTPSATRRYTRILLTWIQKRIRRPSL